MLFGRLEFLNAPRILRRTLDKLVGKAGWAAVVISTVMLSGCSVAVSGNPLVGKWEEFRHSESLAFFENGTFAMTDSDGQQTVGNYQILDSSHVEMERAIPILGKDVKVFEFERSGDEVIFTYPNGIKGKYERSA